MRNSLLIGDFMCKITEMRQHFSRCNCTILTTYLFTQDITVSSRVQLNNDDTHYPEGTPLPYLVTSPYGGLTIRRLTNQKSAFLTYALDCDVQP